MATHAILTGTQEKGSPKSLQQNIQENTTISGDLNTRTERFYRLCHLGLVWMKASPRQLLPGSQAGSVWIRPWESCLGQAVSPGVRFYSPAVGWTCLAQADSPGHQPNKPLPSRWSPHGSLRSSCAAGPST